MEDWAEEEKGSNGSPTENPNRPIKIDSEGHTLPTVIRGFVDGVFYSGGGGAPIYRRVKSATVEAAPKLREASRNSARDLMTWTRKGSSLRALLVITAGSITLLSLSGLMVFMFFLFAATANAIVISFLVSLAAAGGFLAFFFACLAAVYVGFLSVAIFIISTVTFLTIVGVLIASGWIGFFLVVWYAVRKSMELTKKSVTMTSSAISAYSSARHQPRHDGKFE
ncbi:hypothetical protein LUZ60_000257 [Juncus effusus]|nr:hypothetical protein LUZ60_000257 [Juncus effusus]